MSNYFSSFKIPRVIENYIYEYFIEKNQLLFNNFLYFRDKMNSKVL